MKEVRSIAEAVFLNAKEKPDAKAVIDKSGPVTYRQMKESITSCALILVKLGVRTGDRVVAECSQDAMFLAFDLACEVTGAIFVGVERKVAPGRLEEILEQTQPVLLVTNRPAQISREIRKCLTWKEWNALLSARQEEMKKEESGSTDKVRDDALGVLGRAQDAASEGPDRLPDPEAVAEILFSTGTTGKTKGAILTNRANVANAQNVIDGVLMEPDTVELVPLPINHAHGLRTAYAHLLNGSCVLIANGITFPRVLIDLIEKYGANAIDLSPSAAQMLITTSRRRLKEIAPKIRYVEVGTAFLPESTKSMLRDCFPDAKLYNFYGSSESGRACCLEFGSGKDQPGCIGKPVPNARFVVLDENGAVMKSDAEHTGRLASAGPMNMSGYWNEPELSAETLQDGYVLTADVAYIDQDGYVYVLGRQDDVIVYKGIKISPDEIEEAAKGCEMVADCACIPVEDELAGQVPKLFVVPADRETWSEEAVFAYLKEHIDDNRMPRTIELIDAVPRTYNGKVLRRELAGSRIL